MKTTLPQNWIIEKLKCFLTPPNSRDTKSWRVMWYVSRVSFLLLCWSLAKDISFIDDRKRPGQSLLEATLEATFIEPFWPTLIIPPISHSCSTEFPYYWNSIWNENFKTPESLKITYWKAPSPHELDKLTAPIDIATSCVSYSSGFISGYEREEDLQRLAWKIKLWARMNSFVGFFPKELLEKSPFTIAFADRYIPSGYAGVFEPDNSRIAIRPKIDTVEYAWIHELIHAVIHTEREKKFYQDWEETFYKNGSKKDKKDFARDYGMENAFEDVATIGEFIFSQEGWSQLQVRIRKSKTLWIKVDTLIWQLESQSWWIMGKELFRSIKDWKVKNAVDAQDYFTRARNMSTAGLAIAYQNYANTREQCSREVYAHNEYHTVLRRARGFSDLIDNCIHIKHKDPK